MYDGRVTWCDRTRGNEDEGAVGGFRDHGAEAGVKEVVWREIEEDRKQTWTSMLNVQR